MANWCAMHKRDTNSTNLQIQLGIRALGLEFLDKLCSDIRNSRVDLCSRTDPSVCRDDVSSLYISISTIF